MMSGINCGSRPTMLSACYIFSESLALQVLVHGLMSNTALFRMSAECDRGQ